jgi:hypothetical protein
MRDTIFAHSTHNHYPSSPGLLNWNPEAEDHVSA